MKSCEDCGSHVDKLDRCSNCHEELIINDDQMSEFPQVTSDEWKETVLIQRKAVKEKNS